MSTAYLSIKQSSSSDQQSDVYIEKRKSDKTVPCGAPEFVLVALDVNAGLNLTNCGLEIR